MRKFLFFFLAAFAVLSSCRQAETTPRPTIPLVNATLSDTTGLRQLAATAGHQGAQGAIALIGDPADAIRLARYFQHVDVLDNIDARPRRDSLPDFAGEEFQVILDALNAPYAHIDLDSLREAAVRNALFAWDSTCYKRSADRAASLQKSRSKVLIFTSPQQEAYGRFDVDTLLELTGGVTPVLTPVQVMLDQAVAAGARHIAVWAGRSVRASGAFEEAFEALLPDGTISVITPDAALDVRTELRSLLRQYRTTDRPLDALLLTDYHADLESLQSEIALIGVSSLEEDRAFSRMMSSSFFLLEPCSSLSRATYRLLRQENLFTHRISLPLVRYYETAESLTGDPVLVEAGTQYVQSAYVSDFD